MGYLDYEWKNIFFYESCYYVQGPDHSVEAKMTQSCTLNFGNSHTHDSVLQQCSTVNILLRAQTNK